MTLRGTGVKSKTWLLLSAAGGLLLLVASLRHSLVFEAADHVEPESIEQPRPDPAFQALLDEARGYLEEGRFGEALRSYETARQAARTDSSEMLLVLSELGLTFKQLGDFHQALSLYSQALELARQSGEPEPVGRILHNMGACYTSLGEFALAMDALKEALETRTSPRGRAVTLTAIATLHDLEGDHELAVTLLRQALVLRRADVSLSEEERRRGLATTLDHLASAARKGGRFEEARRAYESGRSLLLGSSYVVDLAIVDSNLGQLLVELGEPDAALALLDPAQSVLAESGQRQARATALLGVARARQMRSEAELARQALDQALEIVESLREEVDNPHLRSTLLASHRFFYESAVHLAMSQHEDEPRRGHHLGALEIAERAKARNLLDLLLDEPRSRRRAEDPELGERVRPLEDELNHLEHERLSILQRGASLAEVAEVEKAQRAVILKNEEAWSDLQAERSNVLSTPSARQIQDLLDPETRFLVYSLGDDVSYLWLVGPDAVISHSLPKRAALEELCQNVQRALALSDQPGGRDPGPESELGALLLPLELGPLLSLRLVVVPDGFLHSMPFAALPDPRTGRPLIHDHAIVTLPSISVLDVLRRRGSTRKPAPHRLTVVADPVYGPSDARLRKPPAQDSGRGQPALARLHHSTREASNILALVPPSQSFGLFGFEANRDAILGGALASFQIVHLSVHGDLVEDRPELTSLVFSTVDRQGRPRDGRLFVHEIDDLDLPCELIVLSACNSARGKVIRGEGMVGLTQAVFRAGANRALVSLWYVDDEATTELMIRFYRALLLDRQPPPEALQTAQLALATDDRWRAPYFWAGFVLQGDWRWNGDSSISP